MTKHIFFAVRPVQDINIKYWASWKVNTTIFDAAGLPWYCYTYRQTHCRPLFHLGPILQSSVSAENFSD
jgi:hypothetical protein